MKKYLTLNTTEQVAYDAHRIDAILEGGRILGELGIVVVGKVAKEDDLPPPATYVGAYGDAYLVGAEPPYDYYIFTRPFPGESVPQWFNIGQFPLPGPQGERGPAGEVKKGDRGSLWYVGRTPAPQFTPPTGEHFREWDVYLDAETGDVSQYKNNTWVAYGNIIGPRGITGQTGPRGSKWFSGAGLPDIVGPKTGVINDDLYFDTTTGSVWKRINNSWKIQYNLTGPQGPSGKNAVAVTIVGTYPSLSAWESQRPEPTQSIRNNAYLVDEVGIYYLWVITETSPTDSTLTWTRVGAYEGSQIYVGGQVVDIWDADTKLDKQTFSDGYAHLYAADGNKQTTFKLSSAGFASTVALRSTNGTVKGAAPIEGNDLTTKAYVDNAVANAGGGGSAPTIHSMSIKVSSAWLVDKVLGYSVKEGNGPPLSQPSVLPLPEMGMFSLNGAWSSAGYSRLFTAASFDYPESAMTYNLSLDVIAPNNVDGLSTSDDRVLCRSYFTFNSVVERNEYGVIYDATLYYYA